MQGSVDFPTSFGGADRNDGGGGGGSLKPFLLDFINVLFCY